ncbi:MAG: nucleoside triphosphate pyrophosphohydrolase [Oscillospiraceae bacterium]
MDFESRAKRLLEKNEYNIYDLAELVSLLRCEKGCPWDRVQTHESIKKDLIEECYEVFEAIDCDSPEMMREELGDVLLQVVFHADIEREKGSFELDDIADEVCKKLILRHPHVFGDVKADTAEAVLKNWDAIKKEEKNQETFTDTLKSVPKVFPSLMRAQKLTKRSSRARADMDGKDGCIAALEALEREAAALRRAVESGEENGVGTAMGDLLLACCNMSRIAGIDAEESLSLASERYIERFEAAEAQAKRQGREMSEIGFDELDVFWRKM